jgi:hypothetical protein
MISIIRYDKNPGCSVQTYQATEQKYQSVYHL